MKKAPRTDTPVRPALLVLVAGFAGMFGLMAAVGVHSLRSLRSIENAIAASDRLFLDKNIALENLRSAFSLYGAETRQYLLSPTAEEAEPRLAGLRALRKQMEESLAAYGAGLRGEELPAFEDLHKNLDAFLASIDPVLAWGERERRARAAAFLSREPAEQRLRIVQMADKISAVNERRFRESGRRSRELMDEVRSQALLMLAAAIGVGLILAAAVIWHVLGLQRKLNIRYTELLAAQNELHQLSAKLVNAQEDERRSIARELHDEVGQSMSLLLMELGSAASLVSEEQGDLRQRLQSTRRVAETTLNSIRNLSLLLRPSMLDDFGLVPALNWQAREVSRRTGIHVEVSAGDLPDTLSDEHRTCVYRVVQEALHNVTRHAQATNVRVVVRQEPSRLLVVVQDNGRGFDPRTTRGMGLLGMEERVRHLGGSIQIESAPGRGALVQVQLPLASPESR